MRHEDELRQLLRGDPIPAEDEQLAQVLRELRYALCTPPPQDVAEQHLHTIAAAAGDAAHEAPTAPPVGRLRRWGRRVAAGGALKIATAATAAAAATGGGLAATGNLPQPIQEQVSDVLSNVGIDVPSGASTPTDEHADDPGTEPAEPAVVDSAPPTEAPPVDAPADDHADVAPADEPEEAPAEPDDEVFPLEATPTGEPTETPSDAGAEARSEPPAADTGQAPADPGTYEERPTSGDASSGQERASDGAAGDPEPPD